VLEIFARRNGTSLPADPPLADIKQVSSAGENGSGRGRLTLHAALRDWHIARRFCVLAFSWMVMCMAYYVCDGSWMEGV